ncbi:D-aminoacyl-tRNA deacylase [Chloroflexi bacterium]|nr:D-aminoacyl-tRNA deacylase [Chloroflexota bacterium]|tara:strand:+ start:150 stop:596 length:447 start_codon:yes stop_codon:yes gene_type:complete
MKALIQRVKQASVNINQSEYSKISKGLLILVGIHKNDSVDDIKFIIDKSINLRIFSDENDKFNYSALDIRSELLIVSQFTLHADTSKGRRPSFFDSALPENAEKLYDQVIDEYNKTGLEIKTGEFGAKMEINLINDGPVTIMLDSHMK